MEHFVEVYLRKLQNRKMKNVNIRVKKTSFQNSFQHQWTYKTFTSLEVHAPSSSSKGHVSCYSDEIKSDQKALTEGNVKTRGRTNLWRTKSMTWWSKHNVIFKRNLVNENSHIQRKLYAVVSSHTSPIAKNGPKFSWSWHELDGKL